MEKQLNKGLYRKMFLIAAPISLQGIISATLGLVDSLMVGALGETQLAAVGIAMQVFFVHYLIIFGFTSGCATFVAQFYGALDRKNIKKTLGFAVTLATFVGGVFFIGATFFAEPIISIYSKDASLIPLAKSYMEIGAITMIFMGFSIPVESALKATQQTKIPLYVSVVAFGTNTVLNYILIFGKLGMPALGVQGAAIATVFSRFLEMLILVFVVFKGNNILKGKITEYFGWSKEFVCRITKNARVTTLNELLWSMGQTLYVAAYAKLGITAYAAFQAATNINNIFYFASFSIGDAALILIGQYLGEKRFDETYDLGKKLMKIGLVIGVVFGSLLAITSLWMINLYSLTELGTDLAYKILLIAALYMPVNLINGTMVVGVLRGGGDTFFAMTAECCCVWLIGVPLAFITAVGLGLPIYLAVFATRTSEIVKMSLLIYRFFSKKWIRNVIEGL